MFVFSLKADSIKRAILIILAAALILTGGYFLLEKQEESKEAVKNGVSMKAETEQERLAFISQFGYEVTEEPLKVEEVIIPEEFDENYASYNEIQKSQNFDLEKYKGCRVKKWTYEVTNYKGYENADGIIEINLLIYNSLVVGADIQCLEQNGFLKPLIDKSEKS